MTQTAVLACTTHPGILNGAKPSRGRNPQAAHPHRSFTILKECENNLLRQFWVLSELAVLQTGEAFRRANPKRSISRSQKAVNRVGEEMLVFWRIPGNSSNPIKAKQPENSTQPDVTIGRLSNRADLAFTKTFANRPCRVRVLIEVE